MRKIALVIVDMQNYYLDENSSYCSYFSSLYPGSFDYLKTRAETVVIKNIRKLKNLFREKGNEVIFLRLCSRMDDRSDLHRFFKESFDDGREKGFDNVYPMWDNPESFIIDELKPIEGETVIDKTTFSPFSSTNIYEILAEKGIKSLVFTGLATSQCVETTARDASDRGFDIVHISDGQVDYDEVSHNASLISSRGVCGGEIYEAEEFISFFKSI